MRTSMSIWRYMPLRMSSMKRETSSTLAGRSVTMMAPVRRLTVRRPLGESSERIWVSSSCQKATLSPPWLAPPDTEAVRVLRM